MNRTPHGLRDRVILLLISGMNAEAAEGYCASQGQPPDEAKSIVAEARKRITVAADFARDEQLGKAVMRLEDLYAKAIAAQDIRSALQAQRELNRLLALYGDARRAEESGDEPDAGQARRSLDLIAAYLTPLKLADASYPVEEHARVAAETLRLHGHAKS